MNGDPGGPPPVDLTPLDPFREPERTDAIVAAIVRDAMAARRTRPPALVRQVDRWAVPALAAAAVVLAVSLSALSRTRPITPADLASATTAAADSAASAERFGLPAPVIALTRPDRSPTPAEIVAAFSTQMPRTSQ